MAIIGPGMIRPPAQGAASSVPSNNPTVAATSQPAAVATASSNPTVPQGIIGAAQATASPSVASPASNLSGNGVVGAGNTTNGTGNGTTTSVGTSAGVSTNVIDPTAATASAAQTALINPNSIVAPTAVAAPAPAAGGAGAGTMSINPATQTVLGQMQNWTDPNNPLVAQAAAIGRAGAAMSGFSSGNDSMSQSGAENAVLSQAMTGATTDAAAYNAAAQTNANNQTQASIASAADATQASVAASQEQTEIAAQNAQDMTSLEGTTMDANASIATANTAAQNQQLMAQLDGNIQSQLVNMQTQSSLQMSNSTQVATLYNNALSDLTTIATSNLDPQSKTNQQQSIIQALQQGIQVYGAVNGVDTGSLLSFSGGNSATSSASNPAPNPTTRAIS